MEHYAQKLHRACVPCKEEKQAARVVPRSFKCGWEARAPPSLERIYRFSGGVPWRRLVKRMRQGSHALYPLPFQMFHVESPGDNAQAHGKGNYR